MSGEFYDVRTEPMPEHLATDADRADDRVSRDIAVIGIACRFPSADGPDAFRDMLAAGVNTVREVPPDRWDAARYFNPEPGRVGKTCSKWGAFLDDVSGFDAAFFRISPREAKSLDPQQRLLLEVSCEALESAGQPLERLEGSRSGVFIGICGSEYASLTGAAEDFSLVDRYYGTGTALSVAAGRIAYTLDLHGPTVSVETACSSSLVAIHLAVGSLRLGEADLCIAGGVNLALSPAAGIYFSQIGAVSGRPACRPFDADADGYVRGEGCGIVVLKRLCDALRDGDHVHAVIKGSAINQDGRSAGLTAPNGAAQEALIGAALADGRIDPADVDYVEAHGTGTRLGDPIEANALGRVYGQAGGRSRPLLLGAVKANIGHLEAAAGVAGFIKAVIALRDRRIPPQINLERRNELVDWQALGLAIAPRGAAWPFRGDRPACAAVSSFGLSGTNAHVVLTEPPAPALAEPAAPIAGTWILPVSARSGEALDALSERLARALDGFSETDDTATLAALCRGMAVRRAHYPFRVCALGDGPRTLARDLRAQVAARAIERPPEPRTAGPAFVFSGQGSHWAGAGRAISAFPAARETLAEIDALVQTEAGWSVRAAMDRPLNAVTGEIDVAQVCVFAAQIALFALWTSLGVRPAAVVGHSMGEIAAACAAGILTLGDAVKLVVRRSSLLKRVAGRGLMASVELEEPALAAMIAARGLPLWIAAVNGPEATVISGEPGAVEALLATLQDDGVFCRVVATGGVAGHSALVEELVPDLAAVADSLRPLDARITFVSSVDGTVRPGPDLDARYWSSNLVEPVHFSAAVHRILKIGCRDFLELSPKPMLVPAIRRILRDRKIGGVAAGVLDSKMAPPEALGRAWGELYAAGQALDWRALYPGQAAWTAPPRYPWVRTRHWISELAPPSPEADPSQSALREDGDRRLLDALLSEWDEFGLRSANMQRLAPLTLLTPDRRAAFYLARSSNVCLAWAYLGAPERFAEAAAWLHRACEARRIQLCLLCDAPIADLLGDQAGFTRSVAGASHRIEPLAGFSLEGGGMKRLRGRVTRYLADGPGLVREFEPGRDAADDAAALALIDGWMALKGRKVPVAEDIRAEIRGGLRPESRRYFAAWREGRLQALLLLARFAAHRGSLLDLEFYDESSAPGATEHAIVEIISRLAVEGETVLSLGGSYSSAPLGPGAPIDVGFERQVRYKRKFGAAESEIVLLRPRAMSRDQVDELIRLMSGAASGNEPPRISTSADALAAGAPSARTARAFPVAPVRPERPHPLLGHRLSIAGDTIVYESRVDGSHRLAAQHVVGERPILPGAAYVEMALAAVLRLGRSGDLVLRDLVFERPLILGPGESVRLQLALSTEGGSPRSFIISAAGDTEPDDWRRIAAGAVHVEAVDLAVIASPFAKAPLSGNRVTIDRLYDEYAESGVAYGPLFRAVRESAVLEDGVQTRVALAREALDEEDDLYALHPAMLDAAMHGFSATGSAGACAPMIQSIEEFRLKRRATATESVVAIARNADGTAATFSGDLAIYGEDGALIAEARGLLARPAAGATGRRSLPVRALGHAILRFVPAPLAAPVPSQNGTSLLFGGDDRLADAVSREIGRTRTPVIRLGGGPGEAFGKLQVLRPEAWASATRLVLLPSMGAGTPPGEVGAHIDVLPDILRLLAERAPAGLRLWIVTRNATGRAPTPESLCEAAMWGLCPVLRAEHPEWWGGACDLLPQPVGSAARHLAAVLASGEEDAWMVGPGGAQVLRLEDVEEAPPGRFRASSSGAYVVTGWTGGIGRAVTAWLIEQGAGHVALLARRAATEARDQLQGCAAQGATLSFATGDVADPIVVADLLAAACQSGRPLRGVFHAAGDLGDGLLMNQTPAGFAAAITGKVRGAWNLHEQTRTLDLDAFVAFSSAATLFGPPAQGPHVAACAALDRLCALRRAEGLKALSIGWGPWGELGKAAERGLDARLAREGILPISPDAALGMMSALIQSDLAHAYVAPVDWGLWRAASPALASRPIFSNLLRPLQTVGDPAKDTIDPQDLRHRLRDCIGRTLMCDPRAVDVALSLEGNGLDSIAIVDLRERLGRELGRSLPLIEFFRAPSVDGLADRLLARDGSCGGDRVA